ncbi:hypothetical protein Clacol_010413 [Clathrus columnatus]|uniref:2Fe-2S ferredoxin-type domain-containing protein n=1 Tax=Clathrus columnatus TaxID=1419009 RepID=A0AAV5AT00_9AGAM|nr:hypothetical protein Clacol_010413 [Clathrus columnatus]
MHSVGMSLRHMMMGRSLCRYGHTGFPGGITGKIWNSNIKSDLIFLPRNVNLGRRRICTSIPRSHGGVVPPEPGTGITIHFQDFKGNPIKTIEAREGDNILDLAHEYDIDLEGACEGSVACSTCHVILEPEMYNKLPEPEDDENDMLDMAFGLTDTNPWPFADRGSDVK